MSMETVVWIEFLITQTKFHKDSFRTFQRRGTMPRPDFPPKAGHKGRGSGWYLRTLLAFPSLHPLIREKISCLADSTARQPSVNDGQALARTSPAESEALIVNRLAPGQKGTSLHLSGNSDDEERKVGLSEAHLHSQKGRQIAGKKLEFYEGFKIRKGRKAKKAYIEEWNLINPGFKESLRTAYRIGACIRENREADLIPKWGGRDRSSVPDEPFKYFKNLYLTQQRRAASVCCDLLRIQFPDIPSIASFLRRLEREVPKHVILYYREGPQAYDRKFGGYADLDYSTVKSGEMSVMDHNQIDVEVLGPDGKPFFPWSTKCADIRSRKMLSVVLSVQPNSDTIHLAFRRACLRFGVPRQVVVDNGKDFRSRIFTGGMRRHRGQIDEMATKSLLFQVGVIGRFTNFYAAKSKPIERSFLTDKEKFSRVFPTFRGGNVQERPEELKEILKSGKLIPMAEFERLYWGYLEAVFNNSPHRGKGMEGRSPNEVFAEGNVARPIDNEDLLSLLLYKSSRPVTVGKNGVTLFGRVYYADPLLQLKGQTVYLRYDPAEVGRVWVYTMKDEFICQAKENQLISWHASEEDMRQLTIQQKKERRVIQAYHQIGWDRAKEPDLLKAIIAKKAQAHGTDLSSAAMRPEKALSEALQISVRDRERIRKKDEEERRREQKEYMEYVEAELKKDEEGRKLKEKRRNELVKEFLGPDCYWR